jgi:hypothetical protein
MNHCHILVQVHERQGDAAADVRKSIQRHQPTSRGLQGVEEAPAVHVIHHKRKHTLRIENLMAADNMRMIDAVSSAKFVNCHSTLFFVRLKRYLLECPHPITLPVLNAIYHTTTATAHFSHLD